MKIANFRYVVLATNVAVLIMNYADRSALGVAAPLITAHFHIDLAAMGLIFGAFALTYAPSCFLGGWLADRFGPRRVMTAALAWWSLMTAATAACFSFTSFAVQRLLFGVGEGPQGAVTARTMTNWFPEREYATAVGLCFAANPLGAAIGTPVVAAILILSDNNWRAPFLALGAIGLAVSLLWYIVVRDRPRSHPLVTAREAAHIGSAGDGTAPADAEDHVAPPAGFYLRQSAVWGNALAFFGFNWVIFMLQSWYPVFLIQVHHVDLKQLAWTGAIPRVGGSIGTALGGYLSDAIARRTGNAFATRKWVAVGALGAGAVLTLLAAAAHDFTEAVALLTSAVLMLYLTNAQFFALVRASVHRARLGTVTGFVHFCANCAAIVAPAITGFVVQGLKSWELAFGLAAAIAAAGCVALALSRRPREQVGLVKVSHPM